MCANVLSRAHTPSDDPKDVFASTEAHKAQFAAK